MSATTPLAKILEDANANKMEVTEIEYDRIILSDNGNEYIIRIWDIDEKEATWTLYKMSEKGGNKVKSGVTIF